MAVEKEDTRVSMNTEDPMNANNFDCDDESAFMEEYNQKNSKLGIFLRHLIFLLLTVVIPGIPLIIISIFNKKTWVQNLSRDPFNETDPKQICIRFFTYVCSVSTFIGLVSYIIDIIPKAVHRFHKIAAKSSIEKAKTRLELYVALITPLKMSCAVLILLGMWALLYSGSDDFESQNKKVWFVIVFKLLLCLTTATLIISLEKVVLQFIAIRFHRTAYSDRIKQNGLSTRILDNLNKARSADKKKYPNDTNSPRHEETNSRHSKNDSQTINTSFNGFKGQKNSNTEHVTSPGAIASDLIFNAFNRKIFDGTMMSEEGDLNSKYHAKKLAKKLFDALNNQRTYLVYEDFIPYFKTKEEAKEAFDFFDSDGNGDISKREMRERVTYIYKERKDLSESLRDISQAVGKLDKILIVFFAFGIGLVWAIIFGRELSNTLVPFGTFCVAISFVFGPSAKNLFESILFVFVVHPYDTGDRVYIEKENYVVEKVGLLATTFVASDGQVIYYPNSVLVTKSIHNIRRSTYQAEQVDFHIAFDTPKEKIFALKNRFCNYVNQEESRDFFPDPLFVLADIDSCNKLKFFIWLEHKGNWQDGSKRWGRKSRVMIALKEIASSLELSYELPAQKIHSTKPRDLPNSEARDYFNHTTQN